MTASSLVLTSLLGSSLLLLLLLLDDSLDNLLLLDQEGSDDSLLDTVGTSRTTVSSLDGLLGLRDLSVFSWSQGGDTWQSDTTVTTLDSGGDLLQVVGNQLATWGLDDLDLVGLGVVWVSSSVGNTLSHCEVVVVFQKSRKILKLKESTLVGRKIFRVSRAHPTRAKALEREKNAGEKYGKA